MVKWLKEYIDSNPGVYLSGYYTIVERTPKRQRIKEIREYDLSICASKRSDHKYNYEIILNRFLGEKNECVLKKDKNFIYTNIKKILDDAII